MELIKQEIDDIDSLTVNPRNSPRGLIVKFEILHGGLIERGAYSREGAYWKWYFLHGAKSKWQVDLQDTIDTQYDLYSKLQFLRKNSCNEKRINYFTFFVKCFDI